MFPVFFFEIRIVAYFFDSLNESRSLTASSHLRFIRRELLLELFSPYNQEKWVHNPLLNLSVHAEVDQIASVNVPT